MTALAGFWSSTGTSDNFGSGLGFHMGTLYVPGQSTATKIPQVSFDGSNFDWARYDWMLHADQWNKFRCGGSWLSTRGMPVHCLAPQPPAWHGNNNVSFPITRCSNTALMHTGCQSGAKAARCHVPQV